MKTFSVMALNEFLQIQNNTDIIFTLKKRFKQFPRNQEIKKSSTVCIFAVLCFILVYGI